MNVDLYKHFKRLSPLLLLIFIDSFSYFVVIPVLLQLFFNDTYGLLEPGTSLKTRNLLTGFTISLSTFAALVAAPLIGRASDRYGRKGTLLVCLAGIVAGFILPIFGIIHRNLGLILLGRFLGGVGSASQPVAQAAVADLCKGHEKSFFLSLIALMMTLPIILGPLAGGYLSDSSIVSWFNPTTPYWCALLISAFSFFLILFFFKETLDSSSEPQIINLRELYFGLTKAFRHYHIGLLLLIFFGLELGWSQYYQVIGLYLSEQYHYTATHVSLVYTYAGILMSLGLLLVYPLMSRYLSESKIIHYSLKGVLFGLIGCALLHTAKAQWLFIPFIAIFTGTGYVALLTLISNRVPSTEQGWAMGYSSTILFLAWLLTGLGSGWFLSMHPKLPLYLAAFFLLFAFIIQISKFERCRFMSIKQAR